VLLVGVLIGCGGSDTATTAAPPDAHVWRKVGETLGRELQSEHGTRSADLPRTDLHVHSQGHRLGRVTLPPAMELSDVAFFQPIGDRRAIANGDIVMTANEIQAVIRALRENDIQALSLHTHMLYEPGETQIVVADSGTSSVLEFPVTGENAGEAFQHPFRYAP
jgi:hypothetical protein